MAWNLELSSLAATTNVSATTDGDVTTFTAIGDGATLRWSDIANAFWAGKHVVIDSGSTGMQAGSINSALLVGLYDIPDNLSLTIRSGTGDGLVGDINLTRISLGGNNLSIILHAYGSVRVSELYGVTEGHPAQLSEVSITAVTGYVRHYGFVEQGLIKATNLSIQASQGIGSDMNPFTTEASNFEAETVSGGIYVTNSGNLKIGGVSSELHGVRVTESGDIVLRNTGTIEVTTPRVDMNDPGERVIAAGSVTLQAVGVAGTLVVGVGLPIPNGTIQSLGGTITLEADQDLLIGDTVSVRFGNVVSAGDVNFSAGRDIVLDCGSIVEAGGTGNLMAVAGGNILLIDTAGPAKGARMRTKGGDITLRTGIGGAIVLNNDDFRALETVFMSNSGDVTLVADSMDIRNDMLVGTGTVTLRTATTDGTIAIQIGGPDAGSTLGLSDSELDLIRAGKIVIGDKTIANTITVSGAIQHANDANFEVLTARNIVFTSGSSWTSTNGNVTFRANQETTATSGNFQGIDVDGAVIASTSGDITLVGRGGDTNPEQYGVYIHNGAQVGTGTTGTVSVTGTSGTNGFSGLAGVLVSGSAMITSGGGNVVVEGVGAGIGGFSFGVNVVGTITAGGMGTVMVTGRGSNLSAGSFGVFVQLGGKITSSGGDVTVVGIGGPGAYDIIVASNPTGEISSGGTGNVTLVADRVYISDSHVTIRAGDAGDQTVTIRTRTAGTLINLGGDDTEDTLGLIDAELDRISAGTIIIGDATIGSITLSAAIDRSASTHIELHTGGSIAFSGGSLDTAGGDVLLAPGDGAVDPATAGIDITAGSVSFASDLSIKIDGQAVDTQLRQLNVVGTVDLSGVDLVLSGAFVPPSGTSYTIVTATSLLNKFNGLDEGDIVSFNGVDLKIHYTGNSVILSAPAEAQQASLEVIDAFGVAGFKIPLNIQANPNDTDGEEVFRVIISGVPEGATFWRGNTPTGKDLGGGVWRFTQAWLENLSIRLPAGLEGNVELTVTARSVETTSGDVNEVTAPLVVYLSRAQDLIAVGTEAGGQPWVQVIDQTNGIVVLKFLAFNESFTGGVRVAVGDLTGDGTPEIVAAQGKGDRNVVRVFNLDGVELQAFRTAAYGLDGFDGVNVALGDVDGDGRNDIVVAPSQGKAEIRVFRNEFNVGDDPLNPTNDPISTPMRRFLAFPDTFTGGAVVAVADLGTAGGVAIDPTKLDGRGEIIVGSGAGMRATVNVFSAQSAKPTLVQSFAAFSPSFLGGISSIDAGRINGDTIPDIVVGAGQGYGSIVRVFDGRTNALIASFRAYEGESRHAAVNLALVDIDGDKVVDKILTAQGAGGTTRGIRNFDPLAGTLVDEIMEGDPDFTGEYWIGA